jgi:hypothetical protein
MKMVNNDEGGKLIHNDGNFWIEIKIKQRKIKEKKGKM